MNEIRALLVKKGSLRLHRQPTGLPCAFLLFSLSGVTSGILPTINLLMSSKYTSSSNFWVPDTLSSAHYTSALGCSASGSNYMSKMVLIILHPEVEKNSMFPPKIVMKTPPLSHSPVPGNWESSGPLLPHYFPHLLPSSLHFNFFQLNLSFKWIH